MTDAYETSLCLTGRNCIAKYAVYNVESALRLPTMNMQGLYMVRGILLVCACIDIVQFVIF